MYIIYYAKTVLDKYKIVPYMFPLLEQSIFSVEVCNMGHHAQFMSLQARNLYAGGAFLLTRMFCWPGGTTVGPNHLFGGRFARGSTS